MSILYTGGRVEIRLGSGDMRIVSAADKDIAIIGLSCDAPAPIGTAYPTNGTTRSGEHPVSLIFTDPRSIDVLIDSLRRVKTKMTSEV